MLKEDQRGVTLVELLVYMILLGLVLSMIIGVIVMVMKRQHEIVSVNQANDRGQQVLADLTITVGNATSVKSFPSESDGTQLFITKTRGSLADDGDSLFRCVGYFFDGATGNLHSASTPLGNTARGAYLAADGGYTGATSWPVVAQFMSPHDGAVIFNDGDSGANLGTVRINFELKTYPDREPVLVDQSIRKRGGSGSGGECWP